MIKRYRNLRLLYVVSRKALSMAERCFEAYRRQFRGMKGRFSQ